MKKVPIPVEIEEAPHVGLLLKNFLDARRIRKSVLARMLGINPQAVHQFPQRASFQTATLWKLCHLLRHNFFLDLAAQLPKDFSSAAPADTVLPERIAALEKEVELLKAVNAGLMEVLRK